MYSTLCTKKIMNDVDILPYLVAEQQENTSLFFYNHFNYLISALKLIFLINNY